MDALADRYAPRGVSSAFIYTREAHPGENYPHHTSLEVKRSHARAFLDHGKVRRPILIDDLEGTVHRQYGLLPNMTWIVARGGLILYKADWTMAADVEDALEAALAGVTAPRRGERRPAYTERLVWRHRDPEAFRAGLERAGPKAVRDFYG